MSVSKREWKERLTNSAEEQRPAGEEAPVVEEDPVEELGVVEPGIGLSVKQVSVSERKSEKRLTNSIKEQKLVERKPAERAERVEKAEDQVEVELVVLRAAIFGGQVSFSGP